jgi:hypothetical protein
LQAPMLNSCFGRTHSNSLDMLRNAALSRRHVEPDMNALEASL